ncbi:MAG TPA: sulfotransferase domain-containing protein [Rudaea sp.]|jgi:hypothetical protein|nr:sulfotransferase domain-containing protein [Rudaea sp.]
MSVFDGGLAHQQTPGVADYAEYDVDIVSPELPCGCAWLVNCLLELDVPIWKPWNAQDGSDWSRLAPLRYRYTNRAAPFARTLPALAADRTFDFLPRPAPRVMHYWPGFYPPVRKTIFFTRDPRDALHSAWHRARALGLVAADIGFASFAASRYFHYPLSWAEYQLLFLRIWRDALAERPHLIVRYEDYRQDPLATLRAALEFLDVAIDPTALQHAVDRSSFERLHQLESCESIAGNSPARVNRAGIANEHRATFTPAMHGGLGTRYTSVYSWLRYDADRSPPQSASVSNTTDIRHLADAMSIDQANATSRAWLIERLQHQTADISLGAWAIPQDPMPHLRHGTGDRARGVY